MDTLLNFFTRLFDGLRDLWENDSTQRTVSAALVLIFIFALGIIELNRQGMISTPLSQKIPTSHYMAINLAFSLVLILEVISLVFTLPASMSRALGKQFEILALILLRNSFKELSKLPEPISLMGKNEVLWHILAYGGGALIIFALLGVYLKLLKGLDETIGPGPSLNRFISAKKIVALLMLLLFIAMGGFNLWLKIKGHSGFHFFQYFYTLLIFSDILLVLIAQSFLPQFSAIFRNSGYALATLLIRLSLAAPVYYDVLTAVFSILFAIFLTFVYNSFYTDRHSKKQEK